jgi:hypothetical protein
VETGLLWHRLFHISPAQAVQQRVGRLMRDDVMRKAGVDNLAVGAREISKENAPV